MADIAAGPTTPRNARRFVRYSLRTMLVVVTLVCVATWYWFRVPFERQAERPMTDHEVKLVGQGEPIRGPFGPLPMPLVSRQRLQYRRIPFGAPVRHGTTITYHPGLDVILGEEHWQDGQLHGPWLRFHRNGTVAERGEYRSGKKVGLWEYFDAHGSEVCHLSFDAGILHGPAEWKPWPGGQATTVIYDHGQITSLN